MARLRFTDAEGELRETRLQPRTRLGRDPRQDLQVLDRGVSKEHAVIELRDGRYWVSDAGSTNGTWLNRRRLEKPQALVEGDELLIGLTRLIFREEPDDALAEQVTYEAESSSAIHRRLQDDGHHFKCVSEITDRKQLERDYEKLRIANELNQAVALELDARRLLDAILEQAVAMFGANRGIILLARPGSTELEPSAIHHARPEDEGDSFRVSRTILQTVVRERSAILSTDARKDSRFKKAQSIVMAAVKATMAVPLIYGDDLLGVIYLDSQLTAGAFADKDLSLLNGFARQAAKTIEHARMVEQHKREMLARGQLARLLPAPLVEQVMSGEVELVRGGDQREASVLFSDIRGFTPLAERQSPKETVRMLNDYFDVMVDIVFRHGGTLDKFIGDAVMAVWGAPIAHEDHCFAAVAAGLEMQAALCDLNDVRLQMGQPEIRIGIGISSGELIAGYMGSVRSMDYTVIGDVVNTASRLCSVAEAGDVLVSQRVLDAVAERVDYQALPPRHLKGKAEPVPLYRILGRL